jgi:hypothetical protein
MVIKKTKHNKTRNENSLQPKMSISQNEKTKMDSTIYNQKSSPTYIITFFFIRYACTCNQ